ncbi:MAG: hypothetical protein JNL98_04530 [Bryobacterales bacterium]|nr:hypothetical protein [Bryobacterales bacterium]
MIEELRDLHRSVVRGMMIGLPVLFVTGLVARSVPTQKTTIVPEARSAPVIVEWSRVRSFGADGVMVKARFNQTGEFVELVSTRDIVAPDLFVYWAPAEPLTSELPERARLLGSFLPQRTQVYRMHEAERGKGYLWIYSLAHRQVIGHLPTQK